MATATNATPTKSHRGWSDDLRRSEDTGARHVNEALVGKMRVATGLKTTQTSGLVGSVSAGAIANGRDDIRIDSNVPITFAASRDTYVYIDAITGMVVVKVLALGAAEPTDLPRHGRLAKVITDDSGITSINKESRVSRGSIGSLGRNTDGLRVGILPNATLAEWTGG